jgi:hypothetical protein
MQLKNTNWLLGIVLLGLLVIAMPSAAYAQDESSDGGFSPKSGLYIGLSAVSNMMSGDFEDKEVLVGPGQVFGEPKIDDGAGFSLVLGIRGGSGALEFGYLQSRHDTKSILFGESKATYHAVDFNLKFDVLAKDQIRPYVLLGFGFPWLNIENNKYRGYEDSLGDTTFTGFALNAGCGLAYYFHPQIALTGGVIYRFNWFSSAEGMDIDDSLLENVLGITAGIAFTF